MKYKLMLSTLLVLFLAMVPNALASSTWYVDGVHGGDGNDCKSSQHACKTIGHAVTLASSGDSILVASAIYSENLTISFNLNVIGYPSSAAPRVVIDGEFVNTVLTIPNTGTQVTLSNLTIRRGRAASNGGGVNNAGTLMIFNSTITGSTGNGLGGGIYNAGTLTISHSGITLNNTGQPGGGVYNAGTLTLSNSTINGNGASNGGGIYNAGTLTLSNSTIAGNGVGGDGGGIDGSGTLTINHSTITGNTGGGNGGGISGSGKLTLSNSAIWGNSTSNGGGIGDAGLGGTVTIVNSTIYGNSAGPGGGIYNTSRTLTISNSTIAANSGSDGSNIYNAGPTATFLNSIVAYTQSANCFGAVTSNGYNLSSDDSCNFHSTGDLSNTDPHLGDLRNNGGPTLTAAELPGSPAMDAGNPSGCTDGHDHLLTTDQRGYPRPGKGSNRCDIGAYEFQSN